MLPDRAKAKPARGKVLAVGSGKLNEQTGERTPLAVKTGDHVLFLKWGGDKVSETGDGDYTLLPESDILAVVED